MEFFEENDADQAIDNLDEAEYLGFFCFFMKNLNLKYFFWDEGKIIKVKKSKPIKNRLQNNKPVWSDDQWHSKNLKYDNVIQEK